MTTDTYHSLLGLRVTRHFLPEPIDPADLDAILEVGRWTGSSKNAQGWEFHLITDPARRLAVAAAGNFTDPVRRAAAVIALVKTPEGNDFDIGRAAQNMMLAAATRGVGSCPVTLHDQNESRKVFGLAEGYECRFVIALGLPDTAAETAARRARQAAGGGGRKPRDQVVADGPR